MPEEPEQPTQIEKTDTTSPAGREATGSDEPNTEARDVVSRAELDKVIRERQLAKQRAREAQAELATLRARLHSTDNAAEPARQDQPAEPAPDGAAVPSKPSDVEAQQLSALTEKLRAREIQLAGVLRDKRLEAAATAAGALNPAQVVSILRPRVQMAASEEGQFFPRILDAGGRPLLDDNGPVTDVEAFVEAFLREPANANLVKASSSPGSGARPAGGAAHSEPACRTLTSFNALEPEKRRAMALKMSKRQRQAMLGIAAPDRAGYL